MTRFLRSDYNDNNLILKVEQLVRDERVLFGNGRNHHVDKSSFDGYSREKIQYVDFRFIDLVGRAHHITLPASEVDESTFTNGVAFDGSSITGFRGIEESDMVMMPDANSCYVDPFTAHPTLIVMCDIFTPDGERYDRDPRSIAQKAEAYLQTSGSVRLHSLPRSRNFSSSMRCGTRIR